LSFTSIWPVSEGSLVAVAGGGGKTGLIALLEAELRAEGLAAVATVTTRLGRDQLPGLELIEAESFEEALEAARRAARGQRMVLAGPPPREGERRPGLSGVDPEWLPGLRQAGGPGLVWLVEVDGSAGRPLKAHRKDEPVLPPGPFSLVMVLGASALVKPWSEAVHRPEIFSRHLPLPQDDRPLSPGEIALFVQKAWGPLAPDLVFINQLDALAEGAELEKARRLGSLLAAQGLRVIGGSLRSRVFEAML
jgi:probable selenium-dependent hydroxylase accessory protein YqeC